MREAVKHGAEKMNITHVIPHRLKTVYLALFTCIALIGICISSKPAQAQPSVCCDACTATVCECVNLNHIETRRHITSEIKDHQQWMINTFWYDNVLPAMMMMTTQLSAVAMQQVQIVGSFLDAKMQLETQQLLQRLQAQAHKDYRPSEGMCSIGTGVRSLASSERKANLNSMVLGRRLIDRQMRNQNTVAGAGDSTDTAARIQKFASTYCNPKDDNGALEHFCQNPPAARQNKDIDFTRTVDVPMTLQIDFANNPGAPTEDEEDIMALATNLYAYDVLSNKFVLEQKNRVTVKNEEFLKWRSVVAKRSVAQNTFNTIIGMKAEGSGIGTPELQAILQELGVPASELESVLGANPSYYAQMQLLSKKIYQNPQFYINLYEEPANVARTGVALQGIELMLLNDMFNSNLRTEMLLSLALELSLEREQEKVEGLLAE